MVCISGRFWQTGHILTFSSHFIYLNKPSQNITLVLLYNTCIITHILAHTYTHTHVGTSLLLLFMLCCSAHIFYLLCSKLYICLSRVYNYINPLLPFFKNISYYAGIMLNAFSHLLCSKLCWYDWLVPTHMHTYTHTYTHTLFGGKCWWEKALRMLNLMNQWPIIKVFYIK